MTAVLPPQTPVEALERLRDEDVHLRERNPADTLMADQVRLFNAMPLRDRLEFLFRTQVATMLQLQLLFSHSGVASVPPESDAA